MTWKMLALPAAAVVSGVLVWGVLVFGIARSAEDICFDDLVELDDPAYGGASQRGELLPPSFTCTLRSNDLDAPELVVRHHVLAWAWALATVAFPVAWLAGSGALLWWVGRGGPGYERSASRATTPTANGSE